mmetsp:Transcript_18814/g.18932  ORF Transcript_18814/g.18932 Transcript_18814/m.18932 type:complete len:291 (+) Transcript_18814:42-914(+)
MIRSLVVVSAIVSACAFRMPFSSRSRMAPIMQQIGQGRAPPGMKPRPDGTFGVAGEHLPQYVLEMDNGAKAMVRTYGCNVYTWTTANGVEIMGAAPGADPIADNGPYLGGAAHIFPSEEACFTDRMKFIPEERAKKLSFDRMIFKCEPGPETSSFPAKFEYRCDVTLRDSSMEWDVVLINKGDAPYDCTLGINTNFAISSASAVTISGLGGDLSITGPCNDLYTGIEGPVTITDSGKGQKLTLTQKGYGDYVVASDGTNLMVMPFKSTPVTIPVGKYKETKFYFKVDVSS